MKSSPSLRRRYAALRLYIAGEGYLSKQVVEVAGTCVCRVFPLEREVEDTLWLPGVLLLVPAGGVDACRFFSPVRLAQLPAGANGAEAWSGWTLYSYPQFDFNSQQPVGGTLRTRLP